MCEVQKMMCITVSRSTRNPKLLFIMSDRNIEAVPASGSGRRQLNFTSIRLACTSLSVSPVPVVQLPPEEAFSVLAEHSPNHHPFDPALVAQLPPPYVSLSLSGVLNFFPLAFQLEKCAVLIASPASPRYPATVSRYLPASSVMENVEYSAEYHRPLVRWICAQSHAIYDIGHPLLHFA